MEDNKTLVEQLREMVELSIKHNSLPTEYTEEIVGYPVSGIYDEQELFTAIADRIEREYLPRPRFEDGEPVQFGDEFYSDEHGKTYKATMFVIYANGSYRVNQAGCNACQYDPGERVKRPEPEVLDADGVPIHVGDTVWITDPDEDDNVAYHVVDVRYFGEVLRVVAEDTVGVTLNATEEYATKYITHKQPDTLERIEEDAMKMYSDYWGCGDAWWCSCCPAMVDGKRPHERYETDGSCASAQKLDLLRRQREVLKRGQE